MNRIYLIAAVDCHWGIGYKNKLLFHLKEDMSAFQKRTAENVVVMGRKTLNSLPEGKPLPNRINVVLTRDEKLQSHQDLVVKHSVDEVLEYVKAVDRDVYIIGGEQIYRQFLHVAQEAFITEIFTEKQADTFFPNLNDRSDWEKVSAGKTIQDDNSGIEFRFVTYRRLV